MDEHASALQANTSRCPAIAPFAAQAGNGSLAERLIVSFSPCAVPGWSPLSAGAALAPMRIQMSATELAEFVHCPQRHRYRYRDGFTETSIRALHSDRFSPAVRGAAVHDYLAHYRDEWSAAEERTYMLRAIRKRGKDEWASPEAHVDDLLAVAERFLDSKWHRRAEAAEEVRREQPFVFALEQGTTLVGSMDLLFKEGDRWTILDYKSSTVPEGMSLEVGLQQLARRYELQAAVYALALGAVLGDDAVGSVAFYFLEPATAVELPVTRPWLDRWRQALPFVVHRARQGLYGDRPAWTADRCGGCPYVRVCRPEGVPGTTPAPSPGLAAARSAEAPASR